MKNKSSVILMIITMMNITSISAMAGCFTGFACSIEELEQKNLQQTAEYITIINNYFSKTVKEINYITGKQEINNYRDIFILNTIV